MSEKNPPDSNFMTKLATFIVDKKTLFFLLYIFAVIFCAFSSGWVNVENDVTTYLPGGHGDPAGHRGNER